MIVNKMLSSCFKACVFSSLLIAHSADAYNDAYTFSMPYSHYSAYENIQHVLSDFARVQGYNFNISPAIKGVISGRFDEVDPYTFMQTLEAAYGIKYYVINNSIYFYHESEWTQKLFKPTTSKANSLLNSLYTSSIVSDDLPISIEPNNMISVEGPVSYVDNVVALLNQTDQEQANQIVMEVFKLKHANAEDIYVNSMDRQINIAGIASVLRQIVNGNNTNANAKVTINSPKLTGLRGSGLSAIGKDNLVNTAAASADTANTSVANIIADSRLNAIIIQDAKYRMPYYRQVIEQLDVPVKLVELHAAIVDIDANETKNLGIDWNASRKSGNWAGSIGFGNVNLDGNFPVQNTTGGGIISTVFNSSHSSFMMQINMLEQDNKARTLGKPSVLTLDNVEATLENTTTNYVPIAGYQDSDLFKIESGTVLRVTPRIIETNDGSAPLIQMIITLQTNQDTQEQNLVDEDGKLIIPSVKQTKINTQAVVREGQSLLLGGYYIEDNQYNDKGIPKLKDIPYAGALFGTEGSAKTKRERLLLITPRILSLDDINLPSHLDYESFEKTPTQSDYKIREVKKEQSSGCSSNRQSVG